MAQLPVKSDFPAKPACLKQAIKEALAPYDRKFVNGLVDDAVSQAVDISLQRNYKIRIPQEVLDLPMPKSEVSTNNSVVCKCHHNLLCTLHYSGKEILYIDSVEHSIAYQQSSIADQQLSSLKVLFDVIEEKYVDFQSVDV